MSHEYSNVSVNGAGCSYNNLSNYHGAYGLSAMRQQAKAMPTAGYYRVPQFANAGYAVNLSAGACGCSGYGKINNAYGQCSAASNQLMNMQCGGAQQLAAKNANRCNIN